MRVWSTLLVLLALVALASGCDPKDRSTPVEVDFEGRVSAVQRGVLWVEVGGWDGDLPVVYELRVRISHEERRLMDVGDENAGTVRVHTILEGGSLKAVRLDTMPASYPWGIGGIQAFSLSARTADSQIVLDSWNPDSEWQTSETLQVLQPSPVRKSVDSNELEGVVMGVVRDNTVDRSGVLLVRVAGDGGSSEARRVYAFAVNEQTDLSSDLWSAESDDDSSVVVSFRLDDGRLIAEVVSAVAVSDTGLWNDLMSRIRSFLD